MKNPNLLTSTEIASIVLNSECSEGRQNQIFAMLQQLTAQLALFNENMEVIVPGYGEVDLPQFSGHSC